MTANRMVGLLGASLAAVLAGVGASAADYPEKPITFIVPASPGGTTDIGVRTWQPFFEACVGGSMTVVNMPGAKNKIGFTALATAEPDGYTIGALTMPNLVVAQVEGGDFKYTTQSYEALSSYFASAQTISVPKDGKWQTLEQLVDNSKATGAPIRIGLSGLGSDDHFLGLRLMKIGGLKIEFIPFGDAALARNALLGGHVDVGLISVTEAMPFQDELRTLAVSSTERFSGMPDVPTLSELGYKLGEVGSRHVMGAPAGIPADIKAKLVSCFDEVAKNPEFLKAAEERALIVSAMDAEQVTAFIASELEVFQQLWATDPWK